MENRSHALWAGFFTLAMICATIFAGIWLNRDKTQRTAYQITTMRAVSGLNPQAVVRYKGLAVGRVDKIEFDPAVAGQVLVDISIDPDTPVTESTFATLGYQGVTGIAFIQLDDDGSKPVKISVAEGTVPRIPLHPGLFERLEVSSTKILASTELVSERLAQMFTPENQKTILSAFSSTAQATGRWTKVAENLEPTVQLMPGVVHQANQTLLSVQELSKNTAQLSQQLTNLTQRLQDPNGPLDRSLNSFTSMNESLQADTIPRISTLSNDASQSVRLFHQTLDDLKEHPQNLIFGKPAPVPGPGEAGFKEPGK